MILIPLCEHFFGKEGPNSPKRGVVNPSQWLLSLMMFGSSVISVMIPSVILSMTYRYEYRRSYPIQPRVIESTTLQPPPTFPCPIYKAGLFTLCTTLLLSPKILERYYPDVLIDGGLGMMGMFLTTPTTLVMVALVVWLKGEMRDWWAYSEMWIPDKDEVKAIWQDRAEKASGEKGGFGGEEMDRKEELEVENVM